MEMNFQGAFENAWSGRAQSDKKRAALSAKRLKREHLRDRPSVRGRVFKGISDTKEILEEIGCFLLAHRSE
jgi:hypothetical protein